MAHDGSRITRTAVTTIAPEYRRLQPWELQHVLFYLGYTDNLADEAEIAAAVEVARTDWPQWRAA